MYHTDTDVFSLSGYRSVSYHPKVILSGYRIIGGRYGRQCYSDMLSMDILNGQPEVIMHVSITAAEFNGGKHVAAAEAPWVFRWLIFSTLENAGAEQLGKF